MSLSRSSSSTGRLQSATAPESRFRGSGAVSRRETDVFRDLHGAYAISGNPRCIGGGG